MLRRAALSRLYPDHISPPSKEDLETVSRFPELKWQLMLFNTQKLLDNRENTEAINFLSAWLSDLPYTTKLEKIIFGQAKFLLAKSLRFDGRFKDSQQIIQELLIASPPSPSQKILSHYYDVTCELGQWDVISSLADDVTMCAPESSHGMTLKRTLANAFLMKALMALRSGTLDEPLLSKAQALLEAVRPSDTTIGSQTRYIISSCHAMIQTVIGASQNGVESMRSFGTAITHWKDALEIASTLWPTGNSHTVAHYALSEIYHRCGDVPAADHHGDMAKVAFRATGRQYHFVGQGTIWLDVIGDLSMKQGRVRIVPENVESTV